MNYSEFYEIYSKFISNESLLSMGESNDKTASMLKNAISKLHISFVPEKLPCRTTEKEEIQNMVRSYIKGECQAKPIYISGMPGTGKTATVSSIIASLKNECTKSIHKESLPEFQYIEINCLRLQSPSDAC